MRSTETIIEGAGFWIEGSGSVSRGDETSGIDGGTVLGVFKPIKG